MNKLLLLCSVVAAMAACRDENTSSVDAPPGGDSAPGTSTKISDVQNAAMAKGTKVTLKGVVVTAIDSFGAKTGNIYVQDPAGGPFSGILVFGGPTADVAGLAVGDIVTIDGAEKDEFALTTDTSGNTTTELKPLTGGAMTITKTGTGAAPAPAVVDAAAIAALPDKAARNAEWEKWEGVLIKVNNVLALSAPKVISGSNPDPTFQAFSITGFAKAESSLAAFPSPIAAGDCITSITGMGDYFFDYLIHPRSTADVVTGGTGCPSVQVATITNIQNNTVPAGSNVKLVDVFVTANGGRGIWVADSLAGALNNGVYLFTGADANFPIGTKVNVFGTTAEFDSGNPPMGDKLTELTSPGLTLSAAAGAAPTALPTTAGVAGDIATGEAHEGVLVSIPTLKVMSVAGTGTAAKVTLIDNNAKTILMYQDAGAFAATPVVGTCLNVTGVMSLDTSADKRTINPRTAADLATGTGCN
jgi:hypothetical protein